MLDAETLRRAIEAVGARVIEQALRLEEMAERLRDAEDRIAELEEDG